MSLSTPCREVYSVVLQIESKLVSNADANVLCPTRLQGCLRVARPSLPKKHTCSDVSVQPDR